MGTAPLGLNWWWIENASAFDPPTRIMGEIRVGAQMEESVLVQSAIDWLTSDATLFWLSWLGLLAGFLLSIWFAYLFTGIVREIDAAAIFNDKNIPEYRTRQPILNRINKLAKQADSGFSTVLSRSGAMLIFGIVVPGLLLGLIVHFQDRLLPGPAILISGDEALSGSEVSFFETLAFVSDQALRGGLSDAMEVFDLRITPIRNNPDQALYTTMIFVYRLICGTVGAAIVYVAIRVFTGMRSLNQALSNLRNQIDAFDQRAKE